MEVPISKIYLKVDKSSFAQISFFFYTNQLYTMEYNEIWEENYEQIKNIFFLINY